MRSALKILLFVFTALLLVDNFAYSQWVKLNTGFVGDARDFAKSDTNLFAGIFDEGVFLTTDNGTSWESVNNGLTDLEVMSLVAGPNGSVGMNIFAGTLFGGIYLSTNNGTSWIPVNNGFPSPLPDVQALTISLNGDSSTNIFAGTSSGVFLSTNNGSNWNALNNGFTPHEVFYAINGFAVYGNTIYVSTGPFGVFTTTDDDTNWSSMNNGLSNSVRTISVTRNEVDTILFAGTFTGGVFRSTNNGINWEPANTGLASKVIYCFVIIDDEKGKTNIFAGISAGAGVYLSTNFGISWTGVDSGLETQFPPSVFALAICGGYLFAGTDDGVWRRPVAEMITSVQHSNDNIPNEFILRQNYPNPFNPTTSISYEIPFSGFASLKVYDILGREIKTLVNGMKDLGEYTIKFDARDLPSGMYFYTLRAENFVETKKMLLLK